ncbi:GNAT family N-acetyltransferase [Clostridium sp. D2Q-14]|uniref:GNAT family N-acetyltransferase n=1 Tax=Anaeromonas gelatinilytica TaxID=2683194 RepID=UPI00193C6615|nr:GNAT family N-acetyltransferase [Anaeromonas gelatinilytica]
MATIISKYYKINEKKVEIRNAIISDAYQMVELVRKLASETKFMMREPDEVNTEIEDQEKRIETLLKSDKGLLLVSVVDDQIVGFLVISTRDLRRVKHSGNLVIGVEKKYWGTGIAKYLMEEMLNWSKSIGLRRLELDVVEENTRGIELYKKYGFKVEGKKIEDHYVGNGQYLNTIMMGNIIN